jgi:hypothetical protein
LLHCLPSLTVLAANGLWKVLGGYTRFGQELQLPPKVILTPDGLLDAHRYVFDDQARNAASIVLAGLRWRIYDLDPTSAVESLGAYDEVPEVS